MYSTHVPYDGGIFIGVDKPNELNHHYSILFPDDFQTKPRSTTTKNDFDRLTKLSHQS